MSEHDQRFKVILQEFFREFILLFFPLWAERFDFDALAWLTQELFLDPPTGERQYVDLVARLPVLQPVQRQPDAPDEWLALVHVEIEAPDSVAPLRRRMFDYYRHLEQRHGLPVLPIGLYLRVGLNGLGWDVYEQWFWEHRLVHFEYAYIGLPALEALEYVEGSNWLGVALAVLMRVRPEEQARLKARALQRLAPCPESAARRFLLCECVEAYLPLEGPQLADYEQLLLTEAYQEARIVAQTSYEKGIEKGQRSLLEELLEQQFGPLSAAVRERLVHWPADRLSELARALLTAKSLKDLGLEDGAANRD